MEEKTYHLVTFGCQMNVRDSQWLEAMLQARGFKESEAANSSVIILNTCSVRDKPEQKVKSAIFRLAANAAPATLFVISGCVAQQLGEKLFDVLPGIRLVTGADGLAGAPAAIDYLLDNPGERIALLDFNKVYVERPWDRQTAHQAFINIMQGCDNFCSYCIVPFTRGRQKSRQRAEIIKECLTRLESGAVELTLLGQNVNAWGRDLREKGFHTLLKEIADLPGLKRLRFVTPHPADMDDNTVRCFAELPCLCPRLHLPLQAGSDRILKAMRRRYTAGQYLKLVRELKAARPDLALTADLIVGFPGETEKDFQETVNMVQECRFMDSYSFCYSERPGTAACMLPDKVPLLESRERLSRLQAVQESLTSAWLKKRVGRETEILMEKPSKNGENSWQGRDVYGDIVHVALPTPPSAPFLKVKITEAKKHTLAGMRI